MKIKLFSSRTALITGLLILVLPACENDHFWVYTEQVHSHSDYNVVLKSTWFFSNLSGFELGKDPVNKNMAPGGAFHFDRMNDSLHYAKYAGVLYIDGRDSSGNSTWSNSRLPYKKGYIYSDDRNSSPGAFGSVNEKMEVIYRGPLNTPPAHLHLCLRKWDEEPNGTRPGRTWKVSTIVDEQGKDLTSDSDWTYYTDNTMRFEKADRFVFTPGEKRSEQEKKLFGTAKEHATVIGSYTVVKETNGAVSLKLVFPNFTSVLTVVKSRFGYVKLSGESGGKKGILELSPVD